MAIKNLIINLGSASKKYALYQGLDLIYQAHFEQEGEDLIVTEIVAGEKNKRRLDDDLYAESVGVVLDSLIERGIISGREEMDLVSVRIVAPGEYFLKHRLLDDEYLKMADVAVKKAPLHLAPALQEIKSVKKFFSENQKIAAISDSAFHSTLPEKARLFAIPIADSRRLGLYRFGYHGISVQSVTAQAAAALGSIPKKTVVCHLGGGASVTALEDGHSIQTSLGFTPLDGLVMATRVGDIDPGAVLYLMEELGKNSDEIEAYFNSECGLLGLSGKSSDIRQLLELEAAGDKDATLALAVYVDRVCEHVAKAASALNGLDLLILAGTVSERSFILRERICRRLAFLGVKIDEKLNNESSGVEVDLSTPDSKVRVLVAKTDEMKEMAKDAQKLLAEI
ncbi:MAG: acetate/propionate family kinase [Patescibacteria group bacterium]|nr:acetate/propionate family kinase [Patescibacteria group bacterium]